MQTATRKSCKPDSTRDAFEMSAALPTLEADLSPCCPCTDGPSQCSSQCRDSVNRITCQERISQIHTYLHSADAEIFSLRSENAALRQLLDSKKHALLSLQRQLTNVKTNVTALASDEKSLQEENKALAGELALVKGRLESRTLAWEECLRTIEAENARLRKVVVDLQASTKSSSSAPKQHLSESDPLQPDTTTEIDKRDCDNNDDEEEDEALEPLGCAGRPTESKEQDAPSCLLARRLERLKRRLRQSRDIEQHQRTRADDLSISVEAYKIALEEQINEKEKFIIQFARHLENLTKKPTNNSRKVQNQTGNCVEEDVFGDLAKWIENALRSATEETSRHLKNLRDVKSISESPTLETRYKKCTVSGRSRAKRNSFRLHSLSKSLEVMNGPPRDLSYQPRQASIENLLLMVNDVLEKLSNGRIAEFIHVHRLRQMQGGFHETKRPAMITTIV